jgi:hypothetical protein
MKWKERFKLYERLYFNELERREKISARLALPFAVLVATAGLLSFMLNSADKPVGQPWFSIFWVLFAASAIALAAGAWFFRQAWFGHTDKLLPTAGHMEAYHRELRETYAEFDDRDDLVENGFRSFLFDYYAQYSSENAINNDRRSYNIYRATVSLTVSVLLAFAATLPFFVGNHFVGEKGHDATRTAAPAAATTTPER